jgi:hypothetical protein
VDEVVEWMVIDVYVELRVSACPANKKVKAGRTGVSVG